MRRRSLPALAAALAVAALATTGCGAAESHGGADARYVAAVNAAQDRFVRSLNRLSSTITATSTPQQDRRTLRRFEQAVDGAVAQLRHVRPPDRVRDLHARLVAEVSSYRAPIVDARRAFASGSPRRIVAAQGRFVGAVSRTGERVNGTIAAINRRLRG
jgi:hypothetical protein